MLTQDENDFLTRVGPGTPAGELLRRYWIPCAVALELTNESPTKFVRLLGEDLVLFKDKGGHTGLLGDHCPHRGASLLYGRVEERGIACAYHGWLYDTAGNCLETPAEPADSHLYLTVKHKAYPVRKYVGLYWAYMGPLPAPEIPHYDVHSRTDGTREIYIQPMLDCNWLQPTENSVDPVHSHFLHEDLLHLGPPTRSPEQFTFREYEYGIMKSRLARGRREEHPLIFPNILRQGNGTQIRVPVDDTHTLVIRVQFTPSERETSDPHRDDPPVFYVAPYKTPADAVYPVARFSLTRDVQSEDHMAWESQGLIADRAHERLASTDRGIVMYRDMLQREILRVQEGADPLGVIRDPDHPIIDTNLDDTLAAGIITRERTSVRRAEP
ncbi:MAG TPA: Rieske 2Fe-2S domain-containing protein [Chloroflexota bacterium]